MLSSANLNDKTYEELLAEAIAQIPLYSKEWTNFNVSDPGITILQNMTAFQLLQQEAVNQVSNDLRRKLLKLVGFRPRENQPATLLLQAPPDGGATLPAGYRLWSGTIPFETTQETECNPWGLSAVYASQAGQLRDITYLLDSKNDSFAYPFGAKPTADAALICVFSGVPEVGQPLHFWVQPAEENLRTPFGQDDGPLFASVRWQYYTELGWEDAEAQDDTRGFLQTGEITLNLQRGNPAVWAEAPVSGCAIRCLLEEAHYDRSPRLRAFASHLFPVVQQETRARCFVFPGWESVELRDNLSLCGNLYVFCREEENGSYREYRAATAAPTAGRFYRREETAEGLRITFSAERFGYAPCETDDAIRISCFDNEMIHHRSLGLCLGYENQSINLTLVENVLPERFSLAVEVPAQNGPSDWYFIPPEDHSIDSLGYHIRSHAGQLVIFHAGFGGDCRLYLCDCVVTQGSRGNLRAGTTLEHRGGYDGSEVDRTFFSPAPARNGASYETVEEVRLRFAAQMRRVSAAATAADYEALVRNTPGLCIHKVKALAFGRKNLVKITVKPYTEESFPLLPASYIQQIAAYLEPRRMLTTRFELEQPRYVAIHVNATLCVHGVTSHIQEETEALLRQALDYVNGPQEFGSWVRFNEIYQKLSALPFVEAVDSLSIFPMGQDATLVGSDIRLDDCSLCYPGTITLTLRGRGR